jgi:hypothetical protein
MSERFSNRAGPEGEYFETNRFRSCRCFWRAALLSALALSDWRGHLAMCNSVFSWLFGFIYFFTLCCGCLFWTIVHHATDAEWSVVVRRQLENIALFSCASLFLRSRFLLLAIIFLSG